MYRAYAVINSSVIVVLILWTYLANSVGIEGNTVGELSSKYETLFTPAGYAFSIWGVIFASLVGHAGFQLKRAFGTGDDTFIVQIGPWLTTANILNGLWTWAWLSEHTTLSVALMIGVLACLCRVIVRLDMERWDAPQSLILGVWWPISLYAGWISIATVANTAAALVKLGWQGGPLSPQAWTVLLIALVVGLNFVLIATRNLREFAAVTVWALIAIAVKHWEGSALLRWAALCGAGALTIAIARHAFQHRRTLPLLRTLYRRAS